MLFAPGTGVEIPDPPKESVLLQQLFWAGFDAMHFVSEIFGQKISLPVAQRDPYRFPKMSFIHRAKAQGRLEGWNSEPLCARAAWEQHHGFFPCLCQNLMSWQRQQCCKTPRNSAGMLKGF